MEKNEKKKKIKMKRKIKTKVKMIKVIKKENNQPSTLTLINKIKKFVKTS